MAISIGALYNRFSSSCCWLRTRGTGRYASTYGDDSSPRSVYPRANGYRPRCVYTYPSAYTARYAYTYDNAYPPASTSAPTQTPTQSDPPIPDWVFDPSHKGRNLVDILLVSGIVWRDDTVEFEEWYWLEDGFPSRMKPGDYTYSMLDKDGAVLETVSYTSEFVVHITPGGTFPVNGEPFGFALPYPDRLVTKITLSRDNKVIASLEPNSKLLRDAVALTPSQASDQNPEERRTALQNEIDALERLIEDGELTKAAHKLENDIKDKVQRWPNDNESDDILQFTKQEVVALIDDVLMRLANAAATPTPTPTPKVTPEGDLLQMAEELTISWSLALNEGNVDFLVEIAGNPFLFGRRILVSEAEIRARYERTTPFNRSRDRPIFSWTLQDLIIEYEKRGLDPSHDRFLSTMEYNDDDIAVFIFREGHRIALYFRRVGRELEMVGFWD